MDKINIEIIKRLVQEDKLSWTNHIIMRLFQRNISQKDVKNAIINGEIIESYESDYPYPSCLIYGFSIEKKILHVVLRFRWK